MAMGEVFQPGDYNARNVMIKGEENGISANFTIYLNNGLVKLMGYTQYPKILCNI